MLKVREDVGRAGRAAAQKGRVQVQAQNAAAAEKLCHLPVGQVALMGADGGKVGVRTQEYAVIPAAHIEKALGAHVGQVGQHSQRMHAAQRFKPEPGEPAMAGLAAGELVFAVPGQRYNPHAEVVKAVYIGVYAVERAAAFHSEQRCRAAGRHG